MAELNLSAFNTQPKPDAKPAADLKVAPKKPSTPTDLNLSAFGGAAPKPKPEPISDEALLKLGIDPAKQPKLEAIKDVAAYERSKTPEGQKETQKKIRQAEVKFAMDEFKRKSDESAKAIRDFGIAVLRAAPRAGGTIGLQLTGQTEYVADNALAKFLFGDEPVRDIKGTGGDLAKIVFSDESVASAPIGISLIGIGSTILDAIPLVGGTAKTLIKTLAKETNPEVIVKTLTRTFGDVPPETISKLADDIAKTTKPKEVEKLITTAFKDLPPETISKMTKGKVSVEEASKLKQADVPAEEAARVSKNVTEKAGFVNKSITTSDDLKEALKRIDDEIEKHPARAQEKLIQTTKATVESVTQGDEALKKSLDELASFRKTRDNLGKLINEAEAAESKLKDIGSRPRLPEVEVKAPKIKEPKLRLNDEAFKAAPKVVEPKVPKLQIEKVEIPTKTIIRLTTGQVKPAEMKLLREKFTNLARGSKSGFRAGKEAQKQIITDAAEEKKFLESIKTGISKGIEREKNVIKKQIGAERHFKGLDTSVSDRLKKYFGIRDWNDATREQLKSMLTELKKLQPGDTFLTPKQIEGLEFYLKEGKFGKDDLLVTKRELIDKFKENREIMDGAITKFLSNRAFPSVDIKEGHPVIRRLVDKSDELLRNATKISDADGKKLDEIMTAAEKSRGKAREANENIFKRLSGDNVKLTAEEEAAATYLRDYFKKAKEDLKLERFRKNYITNIEKNFTEKLFSSGSLFDAVKSFMKPKAVDIPLDVMLAIDNVVGTKKFFRFALQRRGAGDVTTDVRRIFNEYSTLVETKKALDQILPEGEAAIRLLLQNRSAAWTREFLQNLKGRALDFKFRTGKMGWAGALGNRIVDLEYIHLLGANYKSAIKNVIGGESNAFIFQPIDNYLSGKARLIFSPKKAYKIISNMGLLDGSYVDVARQGLIKKGKKVINSALYGLMQTAEYEIRGSFLLGEMTQAEWKAGKMTPERFREVLDKIAITQGIYSKVDSPLFVQTVLGREIMQFNRWRITNVLLLRRISKGFANEVRAGNFTGENSRRIVKLLTTYGLGMYLAYQAGQAGWENGKKYAKAAAETINSTFDLVTMKALYESITKNPTLSLFGKTVFSIQELASYLTGGIYDEPKQIEFRSGLDDITVPFLMDIGIQERSTPKSKKAPKQNVNL